MLQEREMRTLATEAELRALRAQIDPHFLFNALTTIGYLIQQTPPRALKTLMDPTSATIGRRATDTIGGEHDRWR
jgi:LytS/YehU family sensor histidine kinase